MKDHRWAWPLLAVLAVAVTVLTADSGVADSRLLPDVCKTSAVAPQSCQGSDAPPAACAKQTCSSASRGCKDASAAKCAKAHSCASASKCSKACEGTCCGKCGKASACACGAGCEHSRGGGCCSKCMKACAASCKAMCKESCTGSCGTKCKLSHAKICGPRCRSACHSKARCQCGKVSCRLYGIGCGKASHGRIAHNCSQPRCNQPCCATPHRMVKRMRTSGCEPGCRKPCCAGPAKVSERVWVEKSGPRRGKAGVKKAKEVSCYLEGPEGGMRIIKANPGDEHVWVEETEAGCETDRDRKIKKIQIKHSGDPEVREIYIDDEGVWRADPASEDVYVLKAGEGEIAWLGVHLQDLTPELREAFDLPQGIEGALITDVERSSPARKSGVRKGFVVVEFDGIPIRSADDLVKAVRASEPGDRVAIVMNRKGSKITRRVKLGSRPAEVRMLREYDSEVPGFGAEYPEFLMEVPEMDIEMPEMGELMLGKRLAHGGFLGVSTETLSEKQRARLDLPEDVGVMVNEVHKGTAADKVGIEEGDIILEVEGDEIEDTEDLVDAVSSREPGDEVTLVLLRDGKKKKVDAVLGMREPAVSIKRVAPRPMKIRPGRSLEMRRDALKEQMIKLQHKIQELEDELDELEDELEELEEEED